jgi:type III restriction enzyme
MAIPPDFPTSPYAILDPSIRWFPADEVPRQSIYEKLLPPLVHQLRIKVKEWK